MKAEQIKENLERLEQLENVLAKVRSEKKLALANQDYLEVVNLVEEEKNVLTYIEEMETTTPSNLFVSQDDNLLSVYHQDHECEIVGVIYNVFCNGLIAEVK